MDEEEPLLDSSPAAIDGAVDHRGCPVLHSTSGGWTSALFIIGAEIAERFAYYGMSSNLITYLTGVLGESTATAAANVNAWSGVAMMLPLVGGIVADSWLGRYMTIIAASLLYILGLGMLTISTVVPAFHPSKCSNGVGCPSTNFQVAFFFFFIYLIALAQGLHRPSVQAFGADQFDENDPAECKSKSSFFNWWYFGLCASGTVTILVMNYVQDNIGWRLGFGIPLVAMVVGLVIVLVGTRTYRYYLRGGRSPSTKFAKDATSVPKCLQNQVDISYGSVILIDHEPEHPCSEQRKTSGCSSHVSCPLKQLLSHQDVKTVLKLFPIWATCLIYAVVFAQSTTFFTKQGSTMDRRIGPTFHVPPAALQSFIGGAIVVLIPIYDRILIPTARRFTGVQSGLTMLQRIGTGQFLSMLSMIIAALVEMKRLQTARDLGLVDLPNATVPMSLWWLIPQYMLFGTADVFTIVGMQELFYDQVPSGFRSLGLALYYSVLGIGSFISSFLVFVIDMASKRSGECWFSDDLNQGHLDYFYWLLAVLSAVEFLLYLYFSKISL